MPAVMFKPLLTAVIAGVAMLVQAAPAAEETTAPPRFKVPRRDAPGRGVKAGLFQ